MQEQRQLRRRLWLETLETRRVLAGGVLMQNIVYPEDVNFDGHTTALDALGVVNKLNGEAGDDPMAISADVNGDGSVSPGDALYVINHVNSRAGKSVVPVHVRIHYLEKALAEGNVPHRFTEETANEILDTLKNGGLPELGDRFRNGQMVNIKNLAGQLANPEPEPVPNPTTGTAVPSPKPVANEMETEAETEPLAIEEPLDLETALEEESPEGVDWWNEAVDDLSAVDEHVQPLLIDGIVPNEPALTEWVSQAQIEEWLASVENNESVPTDILLEIQAYANTLGDLHDQIAQMFANLDVDAIMEILPDLDIIVEAATVEYTQSEDQAERQEVIAKWVTGDIFRVA